MKARHAVRLALCAAALATLGCGAEFDPPTEIKSLRILGVQKDKPYAEPGEDVTLTMLWHDGTRAGEAAEPRHVQIAWLGGCLNPPADSYAGCFAEYGQALAAARGSAAPSDGAAGAASDGAGARAPLPGVGSITLGSGPRFTVHLPTQAELGEGAPPLLHPSPDGLHPYYGLTYVFFALCAGQIAPGDRDFPIHCVDGDGQPLGPDDFVVGYSAIYLFERSARGEPYRNDNPETTGFFFGPGGDVTAESCVGDACLGSCDEAGCVNRMPDPPDCQDTPTLCVPRCKDDGDPTKCPAHELRLAIDPSTFERDTVTNDKYQRAFGEQMWIDYYSTRGRFHSATKLLNDATRGYNAENGTQFYAPAAPGPVQIWAVMHDNRGGVSWAGTTVLVH